MKILYIYIYIENWSAYEIKIGWNSIYHKIDGFLSFTPLNVHLWKLPLNISGSKICEI